MLKVCSGVTNEKGKDGGYKRSSRTLVRGAKSDGSSAMCYVFERVLEVRTWWFCCCVLVNLIDLNQLSCVGESASPFIDEGDGFTSEREGVRLLLKSCSPCQRVQDDGRRS